MPFTNSIVAGGGTLVRQAIKSPNFVTGVSGWSINKDGSAEFNNVTVRGVIDIVNSSGAEIKADPSVAARFDFYPPHSSNYPTQTWDAGSIAATDDGGAGFERPALTLLSPKQNGVGSLAARIDLFGTSSILGNSTFKATADSASFVIGTTIAIGVFKLGNANSGSQFIMEVAGDIVTDSSGIGTTYNPVISCVGYNENTTPSAGFTVETQTDAVTFPQISGRRYEIIWSCAFQSTVSGDIIQYGFRQDTSAGARLGSSRDTLPTGTIDTRFTYSYVYTATATGNKTVVCTALRTGGTGTITRSGSASQASQLIVKQIS